mmetsp:Transcript_452/g.1262  ORF Transcript_452/g.1262 Transcript_452/m.1262 type:complete len:95 (+) Transcript_452:322-606(+)
MVGMHQSPYLWRERERDSWRAEIDQLNETVSNPSLDAARLLHGKQGRMDMMLSLGASGEPIVRVFAAMVSRATLDHANAVRECNKIFFSVMFGE